MKGNKFKEDFKVRLYKFVLDLIKCLNSLNKNKSNGIISDQLLRSGTSVLANFVEGQSASSIKDFVNYMNYSLKSANESKMWIKLLKDTNSGTIKDDLKKLLEELVEISNIFGLIVIKNRSKK